MTKTDDLDTKQLRGLARSMHGVAMDAEDPDDAATCTLAVDWMHAAANRLDAQSCAPPGERRGVRVRLDPV